MFIFKTTHDKLIAEAFLAGVQNAQKTRNAEAETDQRALDAARSMNAKLLAQIDEMTPDYQFGKARREQNRRAEENRKIKRAAKRAGI